jgi:surface antigen
MRKAFLTHKRRQKYYRQKIFSNISLLLIALTPIYPVFWSYMQSYTGVVVRWEYNGASILSTYDWESGEFVSEGDFEPDNTSWSDSQNVVAVSDPEPVPEPLPVTPPELAESRDPKRDLYIQHKVVKGDTLSTIAEKYSLPLSTLRAMNNLDSDLLSVGKKIIIPRIDGVQYVVKKWDTLSGIASRYGISDVNSILVASDMKSNATLSIWKTLFLPRPTKDPTKVVNKPEIKSDKKTPTIKPAPKPATRPKIDPATLTYGEYTLNLKVTKGCRSFAWWNCTCFVAKYKDVTWRWNAKNWLANAKKQWKPTWSIPKPGAIVVYSGHGFPPAYGHVAIVMAVNSDHIIVKDMNYRRLNEVTTRKEDINHPAIIGYIYVD